MLSPNSMLPVNTSNMSLSMRDLIAQAVNHLRQGQPIPVDVYFRLVEQGYDVSALEAEYNL